jgi:hypothetical protein
MTVGETQMSTTEAMRLRQRARHLRGLAMAIEASPAMQLGLHADDDTWLGRKPTLCRTILAANQHQLYAAAEDLRWKAYLFEQQAAEIEIIIRRGIGLAG